ncbi:MAG: selenium-dependent xanthine dehydrogenase [Oscillospiraceae bacterium]|nr:selenium-dependent xanthine dehydrogenase [Oscillospiraceae bacterium]
MEFMVNNAVVARYDGNKRLIDFLRDDMSLTSVKEGCGEGACGTCMVLIDGKPKRACLIRTDALENKHILTVEGLSDREKKVYAHCFAVTGAVQCGFCIPGMVISAKALIDNNNAPTRGDIKKAINPNICRCTGYVKIIDAIALAAEFMRTGKQIPKNVSKSANLGEGILREDADIKTLGTGKYTDDMAVVGMVYAKALRSKYPRARILSIDVKKAEKHPDCIKVITAADIPGNIKCGHIVKDWDALIAQGDITRYAGDAVALAVTNSKENLDTVLSLIKVEYEELTPLTSPAESMREDAPKIHENGNILCEQRLKRGNADAMIDSAKYVVSNHYSLPFTEHAFMEPECAIAIPEMKKEGDGSGKPGDFHSDIPVGLTVYTGGQSVYDEQREISGLLGIPPESIRVRSMLVGGGFGGKEDMSVQHHAALAAWLVKKPVKVKFSRAESILVHPKRHAMEIDITTACDEHGKITAVKAQIISDTGAYASLGGPVLQRACTHAGGPYNFQKIDIKGIAVYTNNPPAGAFRGFGVSQSCFAMESNLNELASKIGISPWEIRYINAIQKGQELPNGQIADDSTELIECLLAVKDAFEASPRTGIACAFKNSGLGVGIPDTGRCKIIVKNGKIHLYSSAACIGQGVATVLKQMAYETISEVIDICADMIIVQAPDTAHTPDSGTTTASRQTLFSGQAAVAAADKLLDEIKQKCQNENPPFTPNKNHLFPPSVLSKLEGREFYGKYDPKTDPIGCDKQNPLSHVAYGYAAGVAELDEHGKLLKVTEACDVGTVVNPKAAEGQVEGGIVMGLGYALTEDFPLEGCVPTAKYGTLGLTRAAAVPEIEVRFIKKQADKSKPAYGTKGVGELASIPAAPAIAGAYFRQEKSLRTKLPIKR